MTKHHEPQAISQAALKRALSDARLEAYQLYPDEPLKDVLGRYRWNDALCMSLYPILGLLEVTLRNNLHVAITGLYGTAAWYDLEPAVLTGREMDSVTRAKDQLRSQGKPEESNRIVAELNFGFWTSLMSSVYERRFWPKILVQAFPLMRNRERTRSNIADRLKVLRLLRNRVSHHEPICRMTNLVQIHDELLATISWLAPTLHQLLPIGESFRDVYARGAAAYEIPIT